MRLRHRSMYDQAVKRLSKLSQGDVLDWADQAGSFTSRWLNEYRHKSAPEALQEAYDGLHTLAAAIDVLRGREAAR